MRRDLSLNLPTFFEALQKHGYYKAQPRQEPCLEWRHKNFHIIIRPHKTKTTAHLHVDIPICDVTGRPHSSRQRGEDITEEWKAIMRQYKLLRSQRRPTAT